MPMDTTVRLGPLKFSLRATIDHQGPSIHSGHYTASINCCKKTFYCNDHIFTEFGITDNKNSSTAYIIWIDWHMIFGLEQEGGSLIAGTSSPSHWQQVEEQAPKPVGWMMCFLLLTLVPVQKLCVNILCIPYMCSVIYIYTTDVIRYWRSCTPSHSIGLYFWGVRGSWAECHFFLWFTNCVLLR